MPCACCRIAFERDTKVPNAGTFTLQREDHTVGNLVRMCVGWSSCRVAARVPCAAAAQAAPAGQSLIATLWTTPACRQLHRDKTVIFAGYKIPHPLEYRLLIKARGAVWGAASGRALLPPLALAESRSPCTAWVLCLSKLLASRGQQPRVLRFLRPLLPRRCKPTARRRPCGRWGSRCRTCRTRLRTSGNSLRWVCHGLAPARGPGHSPHAAGGGRRGLCVAWQMLQRPVQAPGAASW